MEKKKTNTKFIIILVALVVLGGTYGTYKYMHSLSHEETDDAQIEKNMNPIIPKVSGYVDKVYIKDNDFVKKGDTLFTIDKRDYQLKIDEAMASLMAAEGNFEVSKADIGSALANISVSDANVQSAGGNIETAKIRLGRITSDYNRYENLFKNHSITKQQYEQALAAKQEAESQIRILQQQEKATAYQKSVIVAKSKVSGKQTEVAAANIKKAEAMLEAAKLNLSYTVVTAAIDGQVSKIDIQPGQLVQPGQSLFYIINNSNAWIIANFKETQLNKMVIGQKVTIKVDAYPDYDFEGSITSFSPATGSRFSILPPDNATGNFVKTIQRLPVKISLNTSNDVEKIKLLRPGMNVDVDVHLN
ncbi:HlyD family secretion protein [Flavobacterium gawalongense]|uniref:HlyD family secretion protein n=1 Tax=Flavobacterium gawalongense TaxID=2594432 RepID=A0A553BVB8_9FLAO|nr:HlyD family secretion protein [Flavobacterium gawalongense]TRX02718.1 HlyD family secretion protein [Flavobacterium gawalongense]TRX08026.1 HlyD family secretion protein [Flavobacterium gawalongense]TRX10937.1 HlyD family secretion protein [Flavobacterium gawalongense]TRX12183.1 HlyD family secretion protein [Flavobacterium gawalongense]TRX25149.1 HlyD family secretion protein [Flavobacterium gawalongense]